MPDVLGGLLGQQPRSSLGALETALNAISPVGLLNTFAVNPLLAGAAAFRKGMSDPGSLTGGDVLSMGTPGLTGGLVAPPGGTALGAGAIRRGGKELVEDLKSGLLGAFQTTTAKKIVSATRKGGGYSVNLQTGETPTEGIMVGKYANTDPRNLVTEGLLSPAHVEAHVAKNEKALSDPDNFFGSWTDPSTGKTYLDVSRRFNAGDIRPATKFGEKTGQLGAYNVGTGETSPVGSFPGFVSGATTPEGVVPYAQRLQEMGAAGRAYMAQHPGFDWWRTPNMQRVYGPELQPQIAGLMAATSTNTKPPPNVQMTSEYLRRHIAGEPMIQPEYRVPETALGGAANPGSRMGLETGKGGREHNLLAASSGATDPAAYHGEVVREKVAALGGDPTAIVLDRIQTRLMEQPSAGIYAEGKEGVSPKGANRDLVKKVITDQAKIAGENPDTFSANVWAGVREHVKQTGELYGTPLKGTQRGTAGTESKSYDDLFMDFVAKKAEKLGITVKQMESKLRSGDAELLSHILVPTFGVSAGLLATQGKE